MSALDSSIGAALLLAINFSASISYFIIYARPDFKERFFKLPIIIQKVYVGLFAAPLFLAPFMRQIRFPEYGPVCSATGIILSIAGFSFIFSSFLRIGFVPSIKKEGGLSTNGAYGIVRHPIYTGTIMASLGLTLLNHSLITLLYIPVSVLLYYRMAVIEEKDLLKKFGLEYERYRDKVKGRILPFLL